MVGLAQLLFVADVCAGERGRSLRAACCEPNLRNEPCTTGSQRHACHKHTTRAKSPAGTTKCRQTSTTGPGSFSAACRREPLACTLASRSEWPSSSLRSQIPTDPQAVPSTAGTTAQHGCPAKLASYKSAMEALHWQLHLLCHLTERHLRRSGSRAGRPAGCDAAMPRGSTATVSTRPPLAALATE